jgi:hypothetical protein
MCRKLGTTWCHTAIENVQVDGPTRTYAWGDKTIQFHSCVTCGCTSHWENLKDPVAGNMAVNLNLCPPEQIASVTVRRFDGAETWTFWED